MKTVTVNDKNINLGQRGENLAVRVRFPMQTWHDLYGSNGEFQLLAQRPGDADPYPVGTVIEGGSVYWYVTSADTSVPGTGSCELRYLVDGVLAKSHVWSTIVNESLGNPGEPPEPYQSWVDEADALLAEQYKDSASEDASNASGYAEIARGSANRAYTLIQHAPIIGENGNWFVWNANTDEYIDTNRPSKGEDGKDGVDGKDGIDGKDGKDATPTRVFFGVASTTGTERTVVLQDESAERFDRLKDGDIFFVRFEYALTQGTVGRNVAIALTIKDGAQGTETAAIPLWDTMNSSESTQEYYRNPKHKAWLAKAVIRMVYREAHQNGNRNIPAYFMANDLIYAGSDGYLGKVALSSTIGKEDGEYIDDYRVPTQKAVADFFSANSGTALIRIQFFGVASMVNPQMMIVPKGKTFAEIYADIVNTMRQYVYYDDNTGTTKFIDARPIVHIYNDNAVYASTIYAGTYFDKWQLFHDEIYENPVAWDYTPHDGEIFYMNDE